ncbi:uncharacterized protein LOC126367704 isoform X1 [Pectinophora gossypiella]|nr:uncharacterized protein LOC126367704 isoform X1 [Pectinophora gossypiella]XP_049867326.1 uncharacterized protein LOC126367704 isoform X1 [Pectinophora gossypiella]
MMYRMKNIIAFDDEITLPKCMYYIKNLNEILNADDINISNQVIKFLKGPNKKMAELEQRQDQLLKKLDALYDRIKTISSYCSDSTPQVSKAKEVKQAISTPDEIVVALNPDNLPWFINLFLKESSLTVNITWHIHSSVPKEKLPKINAFAKKLKNSNQGGKVNVRLIFKSGSADAELKLSSLSVPIVGNVNILRYLAYVYPNVLPYNGDDYYVDSLLDLCHQLEKAPEKKREAIIKKLFSQQKEWINENGFSIVDVAAYNVVKQWQNSSKYVPKNWFEKCEKKLS